MGIWRCEQVLRTHSREDGSMGGGFRIKMAVDECQCALVRLMGSLRVRDVSRQGSTEADRVGICLS